MLSNDSYRHNGGFGRKKKPEWHDCDLLVFTIFTRTSRAVCTELAAYKRSKPMMSKCDHGGTHWKASDADRFDKGCFFWDDLLFWPWYNTPQSQNMSWGCMGFIAEHAVKWQLQTERWIWQEKNSRSGMIVTYPFWLWSQELQKLPALNLLPRNDQDPWWASPTTEAPIGRRVMQTGSMRLASFWDDLLFWPWYNTLQYQKHELRFHGVHSWACCQMTATDRTLDLAEKKQPEWRDWNLPVVTVLAYV